MLPAETLVAIFPPRVKCGGVKLYAPTIYHLAAVEAFGVDLDAPLTAENAHIYFYVLTRDAKAVRDMIINLDSKAGLIDFINACRVKPQEIVESVNHALAITFSTALSPKIKSKAVFKSYIPDGLGWCLERGEDFAAEYGCGLDAAFSEPLARVLACVAARRVRKGGENADSYEKRAERAERVKRLQVLNELAPESGAVN